MSLPMLESIDQILQSDDSLKFVKILEILESVNFCIKRDSCNTFKVQAVICGKLFLSSGKDVNIQKEQVARQIVKYLLRMKLNDNGNDNNRELLDKLLSIVNAIDMLPSPVISENSLISFSTDDTSIAGDTSEDSTSTSCKLEFHNEISITEQKLNKQQRKRFKKAAINFTQLLNIIEEIANKESNEKFGDILLVLVQCAKVHTTKLSNNSFNAFVCVLGIRFTYTFDNEEIAKEHASKLAVEYLLHKEFEKFSNDEPVIAERIVMLCTSLCLKIPVKDNSVNRVNSHNIKINDNTKEPVKSKLMTEIVPVFDLIRKGKFEEALKFFIEKPLVVPKYISKDLFEVTVECDELYFDGRGKSIQDASCNAHLQALTFFLFGSLDINMLYDTPTIVPSSQCNRTTQNEYSSDQITVQFSADIVNDLCENEMVSCNELIGDIIGELVLNKYYSISDNENNACNVLSGIVQVWNADFINGTVISVSTGNKCIEGAMIGTKGDVVVDSHAEILSRRGLLLYFYSQMLLCKNEEQKTESIFTIKGDGKSYELKDGVSFYLYISSAPCGDARLFSVTTSDITTDAHPFRNNRKQLRCKIQNGCGTIPSVNCLKPNYYSVPLEGGRRLLTMCCSDKLLKRNIVGLQGALLSNIIEPIYYKGIVIGQYFNIDHSSRALYKRVDGYLTELKSPYRLNAPILIGTNKQISTSTKSKFSTNWVITENNVETVDPRTGKTPKNEASRLCRLNFLKLFMSLQNVTLPLELSSYIKLKKEAQLYYNMKDKMYQAFIEAKLGKWVSKSC